MRVVTEDVYAADLRAGDVIVYSLEGDMRVRRIIKVGKLNKSQKNIEGHWWILLRALDWPEEASVEEPFFEYERVQRVTETLFADKEWDVDKGIATEVKR